MKITVTTLADQIFTLEISEDLELENFKAFCEVESGIPSAECLIVHNGQPLVDDKKSLKDFGLVDGDIVILQHQRQKRQQQAPQAPVPGGNLLAGLDFSAIQVPGGSSGPVGGNGGNRSNNRRSQPDMDDPKVLQEIFLSDPSQMAMLQQNNPPMADALKRGDFETFAKMIKDVQVRRKEVESQRLRLLQADPFDLEAQKLIAEEIKQKNIDANMEAAMEYNPESFGTVVMLYIDCKVNGHPVKAFIDSGAQTTIMSSECAERCNIKRLVDIRFAGIAKGVGTQKIIGRVHMTQIQIGNDFFTSSFSVLEDQKMDMLLGLDMLKRHQCVLDLNRNVLLIGTTGTETPFLPESELPDCARLTSSQSAMDEEDAMETGGGEDASLARAIEESVKEQQQKQQGAGAKPEATSGPTSGDITPQDKFTEADVTEVMKASNSSRDQVIAELRKFNGDKTQAIAALFAKLFKF